MDVAKQLEIIRRGAAEIISEEALKAKLERSAKKKVPLRVKAGFDPTAPDIHLGHTVLLRKLRHFQQLGHKVIFLIGDATGLVGDPSGQSQMRKTLTWEDVEKNAITYEEQVGKILEVKDKNLFERKHNSEWFSRHGRDEKEYSPFTFEQLVELASRYTVARLLERDDFQKRLKENKPISFLELFYPLMQGYDSVRLEADIEIGGSDQKFNMLVGRDLQQSYGQEPQVVITTPLLEGLDGVNKMSKSLGNYIGINEPPGEIFGKVMSVSDALMYRYYELLTDEDMEGVKNIHPMDAKKKLASIIVEQYHGERKAEEALKDFEEKFQKQDLGHIELELKDTLTGAPVTGPVLLVDFLSDPQGANAGSKSHVKRLLQQGAVEVNGEKIKDVNFKLNLDTEYRLRAGNKIFKRIKFRACK